MSEYIAVEGLTIDHSAGSPVSGGVFTITSVASSVVAVEGKGIYTVEINFTFAGGTHTGGTSGSATGAGSVTATAAKVKSEGGEVMRVGDMGDMDGTYVIPPNTPGSFTGAPVEITDANQDKVKAK